MTSLPITAGSTFDLLTVVEPGPRHANGRLTWLCRCACGNDKTVLADNLRSGHTRSCGCLLHRLHGGYTRTHGRSKTPEYKAWICMRSRCYDANNASYHVYGAKGIAVCDRWRYSFENFLADMGEKPTSKHSLDRVDSDKNYEPGNCRWADWKTQARNQKRHRKYDINGQQLQLVECAELIGVSSEYIVNHMKKPGFNMADFVKDRLERPGDRRTWSWAAKGRSK